MINRLWFDLIFGGLMFLIGIERLVETFYPMRNREPGRILAKWTLFCLIISYTMVFTGSIVEHFVLKRSPNLVLFFTGLIMVAVRIAVKIWTVSTLKRNWSIYIEIRTAQDLVKNGPYQYLRHPSYLSTLIELIGITFLAHAYYTFLYVGLVHFPLLIIRMELEEKALLDKFGEEYRNYQKEVPALFP